MAKYLFLGSYTELGSKALMKDGAVSREEGLKKIFKDAGQTLEAIYWCAGKYNFALIVEGGHSGTSAAIQLAVQAAGVLKDGESIELFSSAELDEVLGQAAHYRPAGA